MSDPLAAVCPYCRTGFEPGGEATAAVHACPACGTLHHADCFAENGGCTIFGCTAAPPDDPALSITPADLRAAPFPGAPASAQGTSFYNLNTSNLNTAAEAPARPSSSSPPPPLPAGYLPPPPPPPSGIAYQPPYGLPGASFRQPFPYAGYVPYGGYVQPKSRVAFVLLAVFLGSFGAHNFYAGYTRKAVIQLCLTVCTCFWASLVIWIWAIVEACTVTIDDDGVLLH